MSKPLRIGDIVCWAWPHRCRGEYLGPVGDSDPFRVGTLSHVRVFADAKDPGHLMSVRTNLLSRAPFQRVDPGPKTL